MQIKKLLKTWQKKHKSGMRVYTFGYDVRHWAIIYSYINVGPEMQELLGITVKQHRFLCLVLEVENIAESEAGNVDRIKRT